MFAIAGGPWAAWQTVAWSQMLADYTRASGSVWTGVAQTFDGEHPCTLCREIASAKAKEKSPPGTSSSSPAAGQKPWGGKTDAMLTATGFLPRLTVGRVRWFAFVPVVPGLGGERPPVPPPRARTA